MLALPTPDEWNGTLRRLGAAVADAPEHADTIGRALRRAVRHSSAVDGWSAGRRAGEQGRTSSETTVVESAVLARARARMDDHDRATARAVLALGRAVDALEGLAVAVAELTDLRADPEGPAGRCSVLGAHGIDAPAERTTDLGGLLPERAPVSRWARGFALTNGRLPSADECRAHARGERVAVASRASMTERAAAGGPPDDQADPHESPREPIAGPGGHSAR